MTAALSVVASGGLLAEREYGHDRVVLVTLDGARWQEIFRGLDPAILRSSLKGRPIEASPAYRRYWAPTSRERRDRMMPFLWTVLAARHGFVAGDRDAGSAVAVVNRQRVSYPGYAELLTGAAQDAVVRGNARVRYPLRTVLRWLGPVLGVARDDIAVFGSWSTFRWIVDDSTTGVLVNAGFAPYRGSDPDLRQLSARQFDTYTPWTRARADRFTHAFGLAHLRQARPRVLYLAFNDADEAAHAGRYEETLDALHAADAHLEELWTTITADPDLRQHTTLVLTVDHGRGRTSRDWRDHGPGVDGADETWLGCFGPHVTARGVLTDHQPLEQRQVAATLAAVVGQDFPAAFPGAAPPIPQCLGRPSDVDARRGPAPRDR